MRNAAIVLILLLILVIGCAKQEQKSSAQKTPVSGQANPGTVKQNGKIDIAAIEVKTSSQTFQAGDRLTIYPTVKNLGDAITGVQVGLYANGKLINTFNFDFKAGETKSPPYEWYPDKAGDYAIKIVVDPNKKLDETDTSNNQAASNVTIS